jgi:spore maturation protein CgeB
LTTAGSNETHGGLRLLYLGKMSGTSLDRSNALRRLGHDVTHIDLRDLLPPTVWIERVTWRFGGTWFAPLINHGLTARLGRQTFDLCHVDCGELVTASVIALLRKHAPLIVNYNIDDPFGPRDGARWQAYRLSASLYDLCVVMREENVVEAMARGVKNVMRVYMSADEVSHAPRALSAADGERWQADVLFLGTWFPERGPFLLELIQRGVPLTIRGPHWHKAPEWDRLKPHWKGGAVHGDDYARAIQCAKVNLGLLSKANRDLHTTRSLEIPSLGGLLCAQRTSEHVAMYREDQEALFWDDATECAVKCHAVLQNEGQRRKIAAAGQARTKRNGHYNEVVMQEILARARAHGNQRRCAAGHGA